MSETEGGLPGKPHHGVEMSARAVVDRQGDPPRRGTARSTCRETWLARWSEYGRLIRERDVDLARPDPDEGLLPWMTPENLPDYIDFRRDQIAQSDRGSLVHEASRQGPKATPAAALVLRLMDIGSEIADWNQAAVDSWVRMKTAAVAVLYPRLHPYEQMLLARRTLLATLADDHTLGVTTAGVVLSASEAVAVAAAVDLGDESERPMAGLNPLPKRSAWPPDPLSAEGRDLIREFRRPVFGKRSPDAQGTAAPERDVPAPVIDILRTRARRR